jgi:putative transposase
MSRQPYPSDVTDAQWAILEPLLPVPDPEGRPLEIERREIVNAIFYVLRSGCPWRYLPHDLPVWETAYSYFRDWKRDGTWERIHTALRKHLRVRMGRDPEREPQLSSTANQSRPVPYVGMNEATTGAKRFWGASVICWWIPRACFWLSKCMLPISWIDMELRCSWLLFVAASLVSN